MRTRVVSALVALMLVGALVGIDADGSLAKSRGDKPVAACPAKIGSFRFEYATVHLPGKYQACMYRGPRKTRGGVFLSVSWAPDVHGERVRCESRDPRLTARPSGSTDHVAELHSPTSRVFGSYHVNDGKGISVARAEAALRQLIATAEPLGHPCVPDDTSAPAEGLACPLVLPGGLVRGDWYRGDPPAIEELGNPGDQRYRFVCYYKSAYADESSLMAVEVEWHEGDPADPVVAYACRPVVKEFHHSTAVSKGYHPVEIEVSNDFVDRGGQALADRLEAAAAARTGRCLDAPEGPAPYEVGGGDEPDEPTGTTTIVISGGPGEEAPAVGTRIDLPEDDQHQLVVGGPDGEVIREDYVGDSGVISGYGPIVTDADGNWSVMVTIDVSDAPPEATPEPTTEPAVVDDGTPASIDPPAQPTEVPALVPPVASEPPPEPALPPTDEFGLAPEGVGAVRNIADHVMVLGEMLENAGRGETTIPASDIASLQALKPDYVTGVRLGSGSIIVSTGLVDVLVTPVIGEDGLIEVKLSHFKFLETHEIVQALTAALNGHVADRGGRFRMITVTPEGITITAEGPTRE